MQSFQAPVPSLYKTLLQVLLASSLLGACQVGQSAPGSSAQPSANASSGELTTLSAPSAAELEQFRNSPLVTAFNAFSLDFFQRQARSVESTNPNLISSPLSAALALSMTYNGAKGETAQAMARALKLGDLSLDQLNSLALILRKELTHSDPDVSLALANGLWSKKGWRFNADFMQRNRDFFGAELAELDFTAPNAADTVNNWVKAATQGKITALVKPGDFSPLTLMVLVNAIYFKGLWTHPFKTTDTAPAPFTHADGSQSEVPTMHLSENLPYLQEADFQAVALPYGQNDQMRMYLFLPREGLQLKDWLQQVDAASLDNWLQSGFYEGQGSVALPRFTAESESLLNDLLSQMGMAIAFDAEGADFSGLLPEGSEAYISKVRQKAFIEVNEAGSEASAATSVQVDLRAAPLNPWSLDFNRPFLYLIRDEATGTILFMGQVGNPSA